MGQKGTKPLKYSKVLLLGLNGAGKTTLLYQLKLQQVVIAVPSIAFNVEKIEHIEHVFEIFDLGGNLKSTWIHHYEGSDIIAFCIDSTNRSNLKDIKFELDLMFKNKNDSLDDVPLIILANKQDQDNPMSVDEITRSLSLSDYSQNRSVKVIPCIATQQVADGGGLHDTLEYLAEVAHVKKKFDKKKKVKKPIKKDDSI